METKRKTQQQSLRSTSLTVSTTKSTLASTTRQIQVINSTRQMKIPPQEMLMKGCFRPVPRRQPWTISREEPRPIRGNWRGTILGNQPRPGQQLNCLMLTSFLLVVASLFIVFVFRCLHLSLSLSFQHSFKIHTYSQGQTGVAFCPLIWSQRP